MNLNLNLDKRLINKTDLISKVSKQTNMTNKNVKDIICYFEEYTLNEIETDLIKPFNIPFIGKIIRKPKFIADYIKHD